MIDLLRASGVTFPGGKRMKLENLRPIASGGALHAEAEVYLEPVERSKQNGPSSAKPALRNATQAREAEATEGKGTERVAISFGPRHGPVTARQVEDAIRPAHLAGYNILVFAGFGFDAPAQEAIRGVHLPGLTMHAANVCPDVLVGDLLKTTAGSQLFTVFGQPDVEVTKQEDGACVVELRGVDIYDPSTGELHSSSGKDVAAWFLDTDYDGHTFCICQAFFPGGDNPWEKLQRALRGTVDPEKFEAMRGTVSEPFATLRSSEATPLRSTSQPGENQRIAVKVIDFRGNEVLRVMGLLQQGRTLE